MLSVQKPERASLQHRTRVALRRCHRSKGERLDPKKTIVTDETGQTVLSQGLDLDGNGQPEQLVFQVVAGLGAHQPRSLSGDRTRHWQCRTRCRRRVSASSLRRSRRWAVTCAHAATCCGTSQCRGDWRSRRRCARWHDADVGQPRRQFRPRRARGCTRRR